MMSSRQIFSFLRHPQRILSGRGANQKFKRCLAIEPMEERRLLTTIDLAALVAGQGSTIFGADAFDRSGGSVSSAGDINGDGFDDLIIGAYTARSMGNARAYAGESYVIFGAPSQPASINLANLGSAGITIFGVDADDRSGVSVSSAGDINGDGFDDLIIGARYAGGFGNAKPFSGESYVIFGAASLPATIDLANLGSAGMIIYGADSGDYSGSSVSSAGDINGDGFDDLIIGAIGADGAGNAQPYVGESYVIFGAASLPATIDLANLGSAGITLFGADLGDNSGNSVSSAGDINGDGFDDLLIGARNADGFGNAKPDAGESYVIFGAASLPATIDLANLGSAGMIIYGADSGDISGVSVSSAGDINGDGFDDLIIGSYSANGAGNTKKWSGESYVIFGAASLPATIDLANLGSAGITLFGADLGDNSGNSVSSAGDINGDGFDDLLIGARNADGFGNAKPYAGESYVIFGAASLPATIDLANLGSAALTLFGAEAFQSSGNSVSSAGDINGDGFDDLIIGAPSNINSNPQFAGRSYMIFGGDFTAVVTHQGTDASETLTGTAAADVMIGGRGNDILVGNGGADVLRGGEGDDTLAISDLSFSRLDGGSGTDTLRLDGSGLTLDLTAIPNNRIVDIEQIDITGSGNNTLTLDVSEVLNLSSHSNTLVVRRNAGDVVNIGPGWTQQANEVIGPDTFEVFTQGAAILKIQLAAASSTIVGSFVNHVGYSGSGSSIDTGKVLAKEGAAPTLLTYDNLINTSRGINGVVFDIDNLPGTPTAADFVFQMSPTGAFDLGANPLGSWANAPVPTSVSVTPGSPDRVSIAWPDNVIANRWLRITVLASANTGLSEPEVYYIGHLLGETTGPSGSVFTVAFADITPIRSTVGGTVNASSPVDIDKNGTVAFADISAMRPNVGAQLTIITIPAASSGGGGGGGSFAPMSGGLIDDGSHSSPFGKRSEQNQWATPLVTSGINSQLPSTPVGPQRQTQLTSLSGPIQVQGATQLMNAHRPVDAAVLKDRLFGQIESNSTGRTEANAQTETEHLVSGFDRNGLNQQKDEREALDAFFAMYDW